MNLNSRIARLEKIARLQEAEHQRGSTDLLGDQVRANAERVAADPQGAALLTELRLIIDRIGREDPEGVLDLPTLRLQLLADARAREIGCLLAEIQMGLQ